MFKNSQESHAHSLETLNLMFEYDDFMESIDTLVDLGCGEGLDLEWWATRTTRDDNAIPLNIDCIGVDFAKSLSIASKYPNITYQPTDFEKQVYPKHNKLFDVLWCHDSFQYAIDPIGTLSKWWDVASEGAMLVLILPQTTNLHGRKQVYSQPTGCYYHHTLVSLIHMLAVAGWDCRSGFFKKLPTDPWLYAIVYKSQHRPMDPRSTSWYKLSDLKLLPESADDCVKRYGELQQHHLIVPWLDKSLSHLGNQ